MNAHNPQGQQTDRAAELEARMVPLADIKPVLKASYTVKGWLSQGGSSVFYGPSNVGKTFVVVDLAVHIAANRPWRCNKVRGGPVVYIAAEGGSGILNRLAAIKQEMPGVDDVPFTLLPTTIDLFGKGDAVAICAAMPYTKPALIVVDTLARAMGDGDENTAKDMGMFVRNCDLIREATGAHVLVVHHTGKDEDRGGRGSSSLKGAVDTEVAITSAGEIVCNKQRDMPKPQPLGFQLKDVHLGVDEDGDPVTSAVVIFAEVQKAKRKPLTGKSEVAMQALLDAIRDHGETRKGDLYPMDRKIVHVDRWREACGVHGLTSGSSESAVRMAFTRAKEKLMDLNEVRQFGDYVWRVQEDD